MTATTPTTFETPSRLDFEAVATAATTIAARGQLVTATGVMRELGRGSSTTVAKYLKAWAGSAMPLLAGKVTAPRWTAKELEGIEMLRRLFREEAAQALAGERAKTAEEIEIAKRAVADARAGRAQAEAQRDLATKRSDGLDAGLIALQEQLATAARDREALNAQIERLQAANTEQARQYEQTVKDLRQQVEGAVTRYAGMERHMLLEIDRARTERDQTKARYDDEFRMVNARVVRAQQDLDRVRLERETADARATAAEVELQQAHAGRTDAEQRLTIAEGQVATLIERTGTLASTQSEMGTRLLGAQDRSEILTKEHERLVALATAMVDAAAKAAENPPPKDAMPRLTKAASVLRAALEQIP